MASGRMLKNSISLNERINDLSIQAMLIYTWMIPHADDFGRMRGGAKWVRGAVVPMRDDLTIAVVESCLQEMQATNLIQRYEIEGEIYIQFPSWDEHQSGLHKRTKSKFPEFPGNSGKFPPSRARTEQNRTGTEQEQEQERDKSLGSQIVQIEKPLKPKKQKPETVNDDVIEVLNHLNDKTGRNYGPTETHCKLINQRFANGFTVGDLKSVIDLKTRHWLKDPKMSEYLRPATLFNAEKFSSYIGMARASPNATDERYQRWLNGEIDSLDDFSEYANVIEGEVIR